MEYIKKANSQPADWGNWFTTGTGIRSYDYGADYSALRGLTDAKQFLINEQNGLCAYCQQDISKDNSSIASIEHVVPKSINKELSTNYFNLVAVCNLKVKDSITNRLHCDNEKGSEVISPFIFYSDSSVSNTVNNKYFEAYSNGQISPK